MFCWVIFAKNKKTKNDFKNFQVISDQNILEITSIFLAKTVEFVVNIYISI